MSSPRTVVLLVKLNFKPLTKLAEFTFIDTVFMIYLQISNKKTGRQNVPTGKVKFPEGCKK